MAKALTMDATASYKGNEQIDPLVASIRQLWLQGETDRLALGKFFSELKAETKPYKQDSATGLS